MKKAAIYARVSTITQKNNESIETQLNEIRAYCRKNNIQIVREFIDEGVSATSQDRLDSLVDNLHDVRESIDCLVFRSSTRLARSVVKYILFEEECKKMNLEMISCESGVIEYEEEDSDGTKQLIRIIEAWVAERELKKITKRLRRGRTHKAVDRGIKSQGNCPFGYDYTGKTTKDKTVVVNESEAEAVKMIFRTFIETGSTTKTAKAVNEAGFMTKRGKAFSRQGIQTILQNDFYTGKLTYNGESRDGQHEGIISKHLFTKAQNRFRG